MRHFCFFLSAIVAVMLARPIDAQTHTWTGNGGSNNWNVPPNWDIGAPGSGVDTIIQFTDPTLISNPNQNIQNGFILNQLIVNSDNGGWTIGGLSLDFRNDSSANAPGINISGANASTVPINWTVTDDLTVTGSGAGIVNFSGAVNGAGILQFQRDATVSGSISTTNDVLIQSNNALVLINGTVSNAGGRVIVDNAALGGTGTISRQVRLENNGELNTTGTLNINAELYVAGIASHTAGTVNVSGFQTSIEGNFTSLSGSNLISAQTLVIFDTGQWQINTGATATTNVSLDIAGILLPSLIGGGTINGNVTVETYGIIRGNVTGDNLTINGQLTFNSGAIESTLGANNVNTMTINGVTTLASGSIVRVSGDILGSGAFNIDSGAEARLDLAVFGAAKTLNVAGILKLASASSTINGTVNLTGGTIEGGSGLVFNAGLATNGNAFLDNTLTTASTTTVQSGVFRINSGAVLDGAGLATVLNLATLDVGGVVSKSLTVNVGGRLRGGGIINGAITQHGILDPGNSAGTITVDGSITMNENTITNIEIGGVDPTTQHDTVLGIGASVFNLAGQLELSLIDNFQPLFTDEFTIIQAPSILGRFANTQGDMWENHLFRFRVEYAPTFVRLFDFTPVPEPSTLWLLGSAGVLFVWRTRRKKYQPGFIGRIAVLPTKDSAASTANNPPAHADIQHPSSSPGAL